jgi:hypothetical protein
MTALDRLIPQPRLAEVTHVDLAAPPTQVWARVRHAALGHTPATRALFALRTLIDRGRNTARAPAAVAIDDMRSSADRPGFQVLVDDAPREVAVGAIGQVWRLRIPFVHVDGAEAFRRFSMPSYVKVAWAIRLIPLDDASTRLELEVRVAATDDAAWRKFNRYFRFIGPASRFIRRSLLRALAREFGRPGGVGAGTRQRADGWRDVGEGVVGAARMTFGLLTPCFRRYRTRWGLDPASARRPMPGDHLVASPCWSWTHGIEIEAPPAAVWPWVAQIGADRGGFYSYQWLENLAGCRLRNADAIHPEWELRAGQGLLLHPDVPALPVAAVERGRYLLAHAPAPPHAKASGRPWVEASWLFLVEPARSGYSRVVSRYRVACSRDLRTRLAFGPAIVEPIGGEMDRRMLLGIKARVERTRRQPAAWG